MYLYNPQSIHNFDVPGGDPSFPPSLLLSVCFVCDSHYLEDPANFIFLLLIAKTAFFC